MINEVDEALRTLVKSEVINGADVDVVFDAPTREWASRRNTPTIDMYLYDIREDLKRRSAGMLERRDENGKVTERKPLPRFFKLAYLITAWTQRPEDEHRLLTAILACFIKYDVMPESAKPATLQELGYPVGLTTAYPPPEDRQVSDVWSSLGGDLKPAVDLVVTMAIQPEQLYAIADAVMAPLRLDASAYRTFEATDDTKHLPDEATVAAAAEAAAARAAKAASANGDDSAGGNSRAQFDRTHRSQKRPRSSGS